MLYFSQQSPLFNVWQLVLSPSISTAEKMVLSETLMEIIALVCVLVKPYIGLL